MRFFNLPSSIGSTNNGLVLAYISILNLYGCCRYVHSNCDQNMHIYSLPITLPTNVYRSTIVLSWKKLRFT